MKKRTKKSGYSRNRTAPQPDGCASSGASILSRRNYLVTLAYISILLGIVLLVVLAGQFDTDLLTGFIGDLNVFEAVTALSAMVLGLITLKLEGALDD